MARRLVNWKGVQMNREIKFRGICIEVKGWEYGGFVKGKSGRSYIFNGNDEGFLEGDINIVIPETVGQFTGLLDKNGEEIYEGDVLKGEWGLNIVTYDHRYACFKLVASNDLSYWIEKSKSNPFEVVGNIYEGNFILTYDDETEKEIRLKNTRIREEMVELMKGLE